MVKKIGKQIFSADTQQRFCTSFPTASAEATACYKAAGRYVPLNDRP